MKTRKRLTREESKEVTRIRLIEAAERLFIRRGFDNASVEEISEAAGYSRGAFYSNFDDKEQVFLAVIDRRRPKAIDDVFQHSSDGAERIAAVREWFSNQWRLKDFIALRMEFSRKATRDRAVRRHDTLPNSAAANLKRMPVL
jgi:AcrR family transcriptional regulator